MPAQDLVLFDGDCAYCNGWVNWIRKHDKEQRFRFSPWASPEGLAMRAQHGIPDAIDSIVLVSGEAAYTRSDAAWRVLKALPGFGFGGVLLRFVPRPFRNWGYDLVARNRHRLGMKDSCELPAR
ncbi:MAG: DUF393 domain-containing protein [Flavobacteriales bacterium]|nr:DUF393 domain-containing protein [Flavobacteriales bacterium]